MFLILLLAPLIEWEDLCSDFLENHSKPVAVPNKDMIQIILLAVPPGEIILMIAFPLKKLSQKKVQHFFIAAVCEIWLIKMFKFIFSSFYPEA